VRRDRQTSEGDKQLGSPSSDWRWWIDRRCRRRAAAADRWWRGRGHSNSGENRGGTSQRVARAASLGPRGCADTVGWLGDCAGAELGDGRPAAAARTLAPVSRRLRQFNKQAQELQGVIVE
jgi:hypothetical protein